MNKELKEQARRDFDELFGEHLIIIDSDIKKSFIDSLIDKTVQMTEERIVKILEHYTIKCRESNRIADLTTEQFISLITNKNDINK